MKKSIICFLTLISMLLTVIGFDKTTDVKGYDYPDEYINGIYYPISLSTGKDALGSLVFKDSNFLEYIRTAVLTSGEYRGYNFDFNEDGILTQEEAELVRDIDVENKKDIKSIEGIEAFIYLRDIYANNSGVTYIDLSQNNNLKGIYVTNCPIRQIHLNNQKNLESLKIDGCEFAALDISKIPNATTVFAGLQKIKGKEYIEDGKYKFCVKDLDPNVDLTKIINPKVDGATGDEISSGYDENTGTFWCVEPMANISYEYDLGKTESYLIDDVMEVSVDVEVGEREYYIPHKDKGPIYGKGNAISNGAVYKLKCSPLLSDALKKKLKYFTYGVVTMTYAWNDKYILENLGGGIIPGYHVSGWYLDKNKTKRLTNSTEYKSIYLSQFKMGSYKNIPTVYASYEVNNYKIKFKTKCKKKIATKKNVKWGSKVVIPKKKLKRKGYKFKGWKVEGKKVKRKFRLNNENSNYAFKSSGTVLVKAIWKKKK